MLGSSATAVGAAMARLMGGRGADLRRVDEGSCVLV
jgi:hypothetical protein